MSLAHLPNELLEAIAANLDSDSLMALGLMNRNFLNISLGMVGNLKPTIPKNATRDYLKSYGSSVRHLDLSASKIPPRNLTSLIMDCRNVTELDVIGKRISVCEIVRAVEELKNLEVLSFSVMTGICPEAKPVSASEGPAIQPPLCEAHDPLRGREFGHLKKLYIEIVGSGYMFDFVVKFMNRCTNVQAAHVNMVAQGSNVQSLTPMNPKRWNTLRSFVFTHFPPNRMFDQGVARFLARIFAHKLIFEFVRGWIQERKYCYIYENGHFNGNLSKIIASNGGSNLLEKVQTLRLQPNEETFREPWGRPQKLRIMCEDGVSGFQVRSILSNAGDWSSTIVELDLTDSHFFDPEINTHFDLITLSPALEGIAVPTCFLDNRPAGGHHFGTSDCRSVELDVLDSRLKKLRLKKICLRTTPTCFDCINTDLTCCNMLNLRNLNQLEEVTLDGVVLEHSAYDFVANPNVRTLKLVLTSGSSFSCLPDLVKHCKKLEKLKLESDYPPLLCTDMWQSLVDCRSLKQLCLGSRDLIVEDVPWSRFDRKSIFRFISQIVTKLEVIHIHTWLTVGSDTSTPINLHDVVREIMMLNSNSTDLELIEERFVGPEREAPHDIHPPENPPAFVGRDLCSSRSFIGKIEARGRL